MFFLLFVIKNFPTIYPVSQVKNKATLSKAPRNLAYAALHFTFLFLGFCHLKVAQINFNEKIWTKFSHPQMPNDFTFHFTTASTG